MLNVTVQVLNTATVRCILRAHFVRRVSVCVQRGPSNFCKKKMSEIIELALKIVVAEIVLKISQFVGTVC